MNNFFGYLFGANQALSADNQQGNQQESDELYALQWFLEQILQKETRTRNLLHAIISVT